MNVAHLFSGIAETYDFLNHLFSVNQDRRWRRCLASRASLVSQGLPASRIPKASSQALHAFRAEPPEAPRILDLCTGTADLAIELARRIPSALITGLDFSPVMLEIGKAKARRKKLQKRIRFLEGDALRLPFEDGSFDLVTVAFGLRNLKDEEEGLREMFRVLRGGGGILLLEFAPPPDSAVGRLFRWYLRVAIPLIGGWVSGSPRAYRYLFTSIVAFLRPQRVEELLRSVGFESFRSQPLGGGIAYIYSAEKG